MKAAQLETMADAILDGKLSVDSAERMLGGKRVHTPTLGPKAASPEQAAHVRVTRGIAAAQYVQRKHHVRVNPTSSAPPETISSLWPDQATEQTFVNFLPRIAEDTLREQSPQTASETEAEARESWNDAEFKRLRWPLVAYRPTYRDPSGSVRPLLGDHAHGYLADPTWIEGQSRLDAELRMPHVRVTLDWQRDHDGSILLDQDGSRMEQVEEQVVMGATQWEYRRRAQGRQPWMSPKTFGWHMQLSRTAETPWMLPDRTSFRSICLAQRRLDREYRAAGRKQIAEAQAKAARAKVIDLIRWLGADPKHPDVVAWVQRVGIDTALTKLRERQIAEYVANDAA